jgi:hypothetical protein
MPDSSSWLDELLQKAADEGRFANLPGEGKPLHLENDPNVPDHLRIAFKLLKDSGYAPEWILHGQEIDVKRGELMDNIRRGVRAYKGAVQDANRDPVEGEQRKQRAHQAWDVAKQAFEETARSLNREILNYNLKVPHGVTHKFPFIVEHEIERLMR